MYHKNTAKSALRAVEVLQNFTEHRCPLRATQIAKDLQMPVSSTDQLLKSLVKAGHLTFSLKEKTYFPGPSLWSFGSWISQTHSGDALQQLIQDLCDETGETVSLVAENDCFVQIVRCVGSEPMFAYISPGLRIPMVAAAMGRALLFNKTETEIERVLQRTRRVGVQAWREYDMGRISNLRSASLGMGYVKASHRGAVLGTYEFGQEVTSIGISLPQRTAHTSLALGIVGASDRISAREAKLSDILRRRLDEYLH